MVGEWQPIETAPRDGTVIDLWIECRLQVVNSYRAPNCTWVDIDDRRLVYSGWVITNNQWFPDHFLSTELLVPTHWMPLPEPPK